MFFSGLFAAFFTIRALPPRPPEGTHLDVVQAGIFTAILVSSSFTMQHAVWQEERYNPALRPDLDRGHDLPGCGVLGNQMYEWITQTTRWDTNAYGWLYHMMSGLHGLHVFIGLVAMAFLLGESCTRLGDCACSRGSATTGTSSKKHRLDPPLQLSLPPQVTPSCTDLLKHRAFIRPPWWPRWC